VGGRRDVQESAKPGRVRGFADVAENVMPIASASRSLTVSMKPFPAHATTAGQRPLSRVLERPVRELPGIR